jgi:hypothetical protein
MLHQQPSSHHIENPKPRPTQQTRRNPKVAQIRDPNWGIEAIRVLLVLGPAGWFQNAATLDAIRSSESRHSTARPAASTSTNPSKSLNWSTATPASWRLTQNALQTLCLPEPHSFSGGWDGILSHLGERISSACSSLDFDHFPSRQRERKGFPLWGRASSSSSAFMWMLLVWWSYDVLWCWGMCFWYKSSEVLLYDELC